MKINPLFKPKSLTAALGLVLAAQAGANELSDQIIIKYKSGSGPIVHDSPQNLQLLSSLIGVPLNHSKFMHDGSQVIRLNKDYSDIEVEDMLKQLNNQSNIAYAEEDKLLHASFVPNDQYYALQWHYYEAVGGINLEAGWDLSTGVGVTIAVLDTGYRPHTDLAANIVGGYDMIDDSFVGNDGDARDSDPSDPGDWITANECGYLHSAQDSSWHGTHVAGTIGAVTDNTTGVAGIAFDAAIVPVRVLGKCGGYTSDIADGMVWASGGAVTGVPNNPNPAQVMNLSLGGSGSCSATTQTAINIAVANGTVVVVAAGNDDDDVSNYNPGNCNNVISVAATDRVADRAYYSNYGNLIDIAAPGGDVTVGSGQDGVASTLNDGTTSPGSDTYVYYQGTSMAAPHVAGVAGLMYSVNPALTPAQVEATIKATARTFPGGSTCNTSNCGDGILDAAAAITAANSGNPTLSTANPAVSVCDSQNSTSFALTLADFDNVTNMTLSGCPSGATCSYAPNPVNSPTTTTTLNITNIGAVTPSSYNMTATGTDSVDANITDDLPLVLDVLASAGSAALSSPVNAASGVSTLPTLAWTAGSQVASYTVEVATDAGFSNIVETASGINGTSYTVGNALNSNTTYFWRVTSVNACGNGSSAVFSFTTGNEVCQTYTSTDVPKNFVDNGSTSSVLNVTDSGSINDVNVVNFTGSHGWMSDVELSLISPENSTVLLFADICGSDDDWDLSLDDESSNATIACPATTGLDYQPQGLLSDFDNEEMNGNWTLQIVDDEAIISGTVDSWALEICYTSAGNTPPVANNDADSTNEDTLVSVDVLANDTDADAGDTLSVTSCSNPANGTVSQNGNNCDFTPTADFNGSGSFDYAISDGNGGTDTASVTVTVNPVNDDPLANNDTDSTNEDTLVSVDVLANDTDADAGDTLSVTSCSNPANGTVSQNGNNCDFTPTADFNGSGSFDYAISDGNGGTDTASVTVTVNPVNDDPVANNDTDSTNEDTLVSVDVLANDSDADAGDTLSVTSCSNPANGTVSQNGNNCDFTPTADFNGSGSFEYAISDGNGGIDSATVTVTVNAVNDDPVAVEDLFNTDEETAIANLNLTGNDTDVEGDDVEINSLDLTGTIGSVTVNADNDTIDYDPNGQFESLSVGTIVNDSFAYTVTDGNGGTDTENVIVSIAGVNDMPTANDDNVGTNEDIMVVVDVLSNDTDIDSNDVLTVTQCYNPGNGTVNLNGGHCEFTPANNFNGLGSFDYDISDGNGGSDVGTVTVNIDAINDNPVANDDATNTNEDTLVSVAVLGNDTDVDSGDVLSVTSCSNPSNGTVSQNGNNCEFTPSLNFNGSGSFDYAISDGNGGTDTASVTVTVNAVNDNPVANDDNTSTNEDTLVSVAVLGNDSDVDAGDVLSVTSCSNPSNGTVSQNGNNCEFTPSLNFNGSGSFDYAISDGNGGSDTATVAVTVNAVNDNPVANDDATSTNEDTLISVAVLGNDNDIDAGDVLSVTLCSNPSNGTVSQNGNNCDYTPEANFNGVGSFTYNITDGNGGSDSATVTVTVNAVNDDPIANDDATSIDEDIAVTIQPLSNDTDVDVGDVLSVTSCTGAINGTVNQFGNNCQFDPVDDFNGQASFEYAISDGNGGADTATVNITYRPVNDEPVANDDLITTNEDSLVSVSVLTNDTDVDTNNVLSVTSCSNATNGTVSQNGNNCEFTPSVDFNGTGSFDYSISDGNGGTDSASVTVTVNPVNDEPSMAVNQAVYVALSDVANPQAQNMACQFDFGPADEDLSQSINDMLVQVQNDPNNILNSIDIDNSGAISYTFSGNAGVAEVTVMLQDDGGTAFSGDDTSVAYTFHVHVQDYVFRNGFDSNVCQ